MATKNWVRFNEDSRAKRNREKHVEEFGGHFERSFSVRGWQWVAPKQEPVVAKPAPKKTAVAVNKPAAKKGA